MAEAKSKSTKAAPKTAATKTESAPVASPNNGIAVAALVVGIVAVISGWVPFWGFAIGVTALILGIVGVKKHSNKGMSVAGIVMGAVGILWSLIVTLLFIVTLVTVGLGGAVATGALNEAAQHAQAQLAQYNAETQAQIDQKKDFKKGETATFGQFEVKVNDVDRDYSPKNSYFSAADGKEYVVVNVTVKNIGSDSKYISSYDLKMNDGGTTGSPSFYDVEPSFDGGNLAAKASLTGNLMYEVRKDADNLKLQYETTVYDTSGSGLKTLTYTLEV